MLAAASGFWSYAHADDDAVRGRIRGLKELVEHEYELLTGGGTLDLFLDHARLVWGDQWELRIQDALEATVFFIPIITPRYFRREECRKELLAFESQARSLGLEKLLLPILYVDVPDLSVNHPDAAVRLVAGTQYEDWRELRLADDDTAEYRVAVNRLAKRLVDIADSTEPTPSPMSPEAVGAREPAKEEADDQDVEKDGLLEELSAFEESWPRITKSLEGISKELETLGTLGEEAVEDLARSDARNQGFAGRLVVANQLADKLDPVAERIQGYAAEYAAHLLQMDPGMLAVLRLAHDEYEAEELGDVERANTAKFFEVVLEMVGSARQAMGQLRELSEVLEKSAGSSRRLRGPLNRIQDALRDILDGQTVIEGWEKRLNEVRGNGAPAAGKG